jgi:hypothetical protein
LSFRSLNIVSLSACLVAAFAYSIGVLAFPLDCVLFVGRLLELCGILAGLFSFGILLARAIVVRTMGSWLLSGFWLAMLSLTVVYYLRRTSSCFYS